MKLCCASRFKTHLSHELFIDSPCHSSHQSAAQAPGYSSTKKSFHPMLLWQNERERQGDSTWDEHSHAARTNGSHDRKTHHVDVLSHLHNAVARLADLYVCLHHISGLCDHWCHDACYYPTAKVHQRDARRGSHLWANTRGIWWWYFNSSFL